MIFTTAIYYTNGTLHIGHAMELIGSDVIIRNARKKSQDAFLATGLDEHVSKVVERAKILGKTPQKYCDEIAEQIKAQMKSFGISYDDFVRTTEDRHIKAVQEFWKRVEKNGDLYKKKYEGWYCAQSDQYFLEKDLGPNKESPESGKPCVWKEEENYFFKASRYEERVRELLKSDFILPNYRSKEMLEFMKDGLQDFSVTRKNLEFAIPVPGDEEHKIYVWFDALINYLTICGFPEAGWEKRWPVDVHIIGKDITRFHTIWWPAMLMSAGIEVPKKVLVHGFIYQNEQKMSKSKGNVIDPATLIGNYGLDAFRYFLSSFSFQNDNNWDEKVLVDKFNAEIVNDLSNFFSRSVSILKKHETMSLNVGKSNVQTEIELDPNQILVRAIEGFRSLNKRFNDGEPWKKSKEEVLSFLTPLMKEAVEWFYTLDSILIEGAAKFRSITSWENDTLIFKEVPKLFHRIELKLEQVEPVTTKKVAMNEQTPKESYAEFDDFLKLQIKVGHIKEAVRVEGSDKLLKLAVDLGEGKDRTIVAGIGKFYEPENLVNKKVNVLANLKPRKIFGILSEGMILAASSDNALSVTGPIDQDRVEAGFKIS